VDVPPAKIKKGALLSGAFFIFAGCTPSPFTNRFPNLILMSNQEGRRGAGVPEHEKQKPTKG